MNKRHVLALIVIGLLVSACGVNIVRGSGNVITESRSVQNFDRVSISGSGEVIITQSDEESLTVEADDNIIRYITTEVSGRTLYIGFARNVSVILPTQPRFDLQVKDLVGVKVSGSGKIVAESLDTDGLEIDVSGSGDVRVESLTTRDVEAKISGSGDIDLAGEATEQMITVSGSGKYRAGDLRSERADVKISGSGDATVWTTETLDSHISGSGSLRYYGQPQINATTSGSGKVRGLGER